MDYSIDTPFSTYEEIVSAVKNGRASLSYNRSAAYHIACRSGAFYVVFNLIIPIISIVIMYFACSILDITKWTLLFVIIVLASFSFVPHMRILFWIVSLAFIVIPFVIHKAIFLVVFGCGIIGMIIGYDIWWGIISARANMSLLSDEQVFEYAWVSNSIAIKTGSSREEFFVYHGN